MKIRVLQKVVSRKYSVHKIIDRDFIPYCYRVKEITSFDKFDINKDDIYELNVEYKPLNTECIDEFERLSVQYKCGDCMSYNNKRYHIKEIIDCGSKGINIYLDKPKIVEEIHKEKSKKLLEDIEKYQKEMRKEVIKQNITFIQKFKNYCIVKLGGSVNEG